MVNTSFTDIRLANMHSLIKISLCFLWPTYFNVCYMYDIQRQAQRPDYLEIKLLNEGKHRRADIFELREKLKSWNISLNLTMIKDIHL